MRLAREIDWEFVARRFGSACRSGPGPPTLLTRLVVGLLILKNMHDLSDERLCERWVENPYFQYFCGEDVFRHAAAPRPTRTVRKPTLDLSVVSGSPIPLL